MYNLTIITVFCSPDGGYNLFTQIIVDILEEFNLTDSNILICGDLICHFEISENRDKRMAGRADDLCELLSLAY